MLLLLYCYATVVLLLCYCYATIMLLLCYCYGYTLAAVKFGLICLDDRHPGTTTHNPRSNHMCLVLHALKSAHVGVLRHSETCVGTRGHIEARVGTLGHIEVFAGRLIHVHTRLATQTHDNAHI